VRLLHASCCTNACKHTSCTNSDLIPSLHGMINLIEVSGRRMIDFGMRCTQSAMPDLIPYVSSDGSFFAVVCRA
jgi:hypothetical protein